MTLYTLQSATNIPVSLFVTGPTSSFVGCSSLTPFTVFLSTEDNNDHFIHLYAQNSLSEPYQQKINKWVDLIPQWRFIDCSGNIITDIIPTIYLTSYNISSEAIGYMASGQFYYIDDMPSLSNQPVILNFTVDFSSYPVYLDNRLVQGYSNSMVSTSINFIVSSLPPTKLKITRNGEDPLFDYYWTNSNIPFIITINGDNGLGCEPILHYIPYTNEYGISGGSVTNSLSNVTTNITWNPNLSSGILSAYDSDNFRVGGWLINTVKTSEEVHTKITSQLSAYYDIGYGLQISYLTGESNQFDILDFNGLDIRRFNESWDAAPEMQKLAIPEHINNNTNYWDKYIGATFGTKDSPQGKAFGRQAYEKIANFVKNHSNIDTCNIDQLYDLAQETDVIIDDYGFNYPPLLRRIMDIVSINQQQLWGGRCACNMNLYFESQSYLSGSKEIETEYLCKRCGHRHPGNRGNLFDPRTYIVSAGVPFILQDKYSQNTFEIVIPPLSSVILSANNDPCVNNTLFSSISTYTLSANYYWLLPNLATTTPTEDDFLFTTSRFCFYNYIDGKCNEQIAGTINWDDENTTLKENISSVNDWYGDGGSVEKMISYILHEGLGLIEE